MDAPMARRNGLACSSMTIAQVACELQRIAARLGDLADAESRRQLARMAVPEFAGADVRAILAARRLREEWFGPGLSDSAWSLLLALLAARFDGSRSTVSAIGNAAGLAPATAQRQMLRLAEAGLIRRDSDPADERVVRLALTDEAEDRMRAYLTAALRLSPWLL